MSLSRRAARLAGAAVIMMAPGAAAALTLQQAFVAAYNGNPSLDAQRASLRALDEQGAIARASGRPQIGVSASFARGINGLRDYAGYNQAILAGPQAQLPIFQGGRVRNAIAAADERSKSGRAELDAVEGDTFVDVATAYMDVLRDRAIVQFNQDNIDALDRIGQATEARLKKGDVTRTDLSQARARSQSAEADLATAQAMLEGSVQSFRRETGLSPDSLEAPPPLPPLPASADAAVDIALKDNPAIAATVAAVAAARRDEAGARGAALPTISIGAGSTFYAYRDRFAGIGNVNDNAAQVGATLTMPLYQGGGVSAQVRQAQAHVDEAIDRQRGAEEQVEASVRAAFASYQSTLRAITATEDALASNTEALRGVRVEADGGERQVLDVLNAELELLGSKTALERARHDSYIAGFQLLNAMGQIGYKRLNLDGGNLYDPMINYRHAHAVLSDFADHPSPQEKGYSQQPVGPSPSR